MGPEDQHEKPFDQEEYEAWMNRNPSLSERFAEWWTRDGRMFDPDTSDVPWFDKRKDLAERAFIAGNSQSRNYVADDAVMPEKVTFANGRVVCIADNKTPGVHNGVFLEVHQLPD